MKRLCFSFLLSSAFLFGDTVFELVPAKTEIKWSLGGTLHTVHGTFRLKRGSIHFDPATGKAGGEIVVDATSGESGNGSRDKKMHKEVLESQRFPEVVFVPDRVEGSVAKQGESKIAAHGIFRIHGADHEMTLNFAVKAKDDGLEATTHISIPYVKWGMKNPSNFLLKVEEQVEMEIGAHAIAPATEARK